MNNYTILLGDLMTSTKPTMHRDGTVTFWSVYNQAWVRHADAVPAREYAAMSESERARIDQHLGSQRYADLELSSFRQIDHCDGIELLRWSGRVSASGNTLDDSYGIRFSSGMTHWFNDERSARTSNYWPGEKE